MFPRTPHLPYAPNATSDDPVAKLSDASLVFKIKNLHIEEKVDGASVGITLHEDHPLIRNRNHILNKGFIRKKKDTTAKMQFRPIWTWFDKHKDQFKEVCEDRPFSIYGEWMWAQHGIFYNRLPSHFVAYDVYDYASGNFLAPNTARRILIDAGFVVPEKIEGEVKTYEDLAEMANGLGAWHDGKREGIYLKVCNNEIVTHRFKMVREDFQRGSLWDNKEMKKNVAIVR